MMLLVAFLYDCPDVGSEEDDPRSRSFRSVDDDTLDMTALRRHRYPHRSAFRRNVYYLSLIHRETVPDPG